MKETNLHEFCFVYSYIPPGWLAKCWALSLYLVNCSAQNSVIAVMQQQIKVIDQEYTYAIVRVFYFHSEVTACLCPTH